MESKSKVWKRRTDRCYKEGKAMENPLFLETIATQDYIPAEETGIFFLVKIIFD